MLTTAPAQTTTCDVECRLQAAARAFNANRWIVCDPKVAIAHVLEYFDRVISPIACFAAGHRTVYRNDLRSMDVAYRRLLRSVVGPPRNMGWTLPWHEILHTWNERLCPLGPTIVRRTGSTRLDSGLHLTDRVQIMVGNLLTTLLESGTIFRNITCASLDQPPFTSCFHSILC